ncbi:MAG: hypothetical protein RIC16_01035 [Rhodospirillales bacterium]
MTVADCDHEDAESAPAKAIRVAESRGQLKSLAAAVALVLMLGAAGNTHAATADWDEPTQALFGAIEAGDLVAVQQAVLDGADLRATDDTGKNPAALAEELGHFTITHFLLAYSALEAPPDPAGSAPPATASQSAPTTAERATDRGAGETGQGLPEEPLVEEIVSPPTEPQPERIESAYFERLTTLNPAPRRRATDTGVPSAAVNEPPTSSPEASSPEASTPETSVAAVAPVPAVPADEQSDAITVVQEPAAPEEPETPIAEPALPERTSLPVEKEIPTKDGDGTIVAMIPAPEPGSDPAIEPEPIRLPAQESEASTEESEPSAAPVEVAEPATESEPAATVQADLPPPPSGETTSGTGDDGGGSFMAGLRRFEGGEPGGLQPGDLAIPPAGGETRTADIPGPEFYPAPGGKKTSTDGRVPEHEQLRAEAIERLRLESIDRLASLEDARKVAAEEREQSKLSQMFKSGVANVEAEARAQKRLELTGNPYPPGFVPPPDGGSSAIRFLQRMGIVSKDDQQTAGLATPVEPRASRPTYKQGQMGPVATADPEDAVTPQDLRTLSFIDSGYAAPPRGRSLDTAKDNSVGALQQIARLLSSPDQRYPRSRASSAPQDDVSAMPAGQTTGASETSASDSRTGLSAGRPEQVTTVEPAPPGDVPLPSAAIDDLMTPPEESLGATEDPATIAGGWGATTTDPVGSVIARAPESEPGTAPIQESGLVDRLSSLFDPNNPDAVGSGSPIRDAGGAPPAITEPTGTWDVVAVEPAAPPPPRMLLGGPVQQHEPQGIPRGNLELAIGTTVLGKAPPIESDPTALRKPCIDKRRGSVTFCIEAADWPEALRQYMRVDTVMYQGLSMISRYDNGVATRFYSLFPSDSFEPIVRYFAEVLGEPSTIWKRSIAPLAQPRAENPTVIWKTVNPNTQAVSILEIRQYDDTRGGFPDEQRGAIMLYRAQAGPIFPQVSALELMRLRPG